MEIVGGILLTVVLMTLLAAVGLTTIVAFGLMGLLGLVTEMSFKRVFFVSFLTALVAPLLVGAAAFSAIEDGSFERDLREGVGEVFPDSTIVSGEWREAVPRFRELRDDLREGRIDEEEFERQLEQVITETTGAQIDVEGITVDEVDRTIRIERE